jgi:hypothetical protein
VPFEVFKSKLCLNNALFPKNTEALSALDGSYFVSVIKGLPILGGAQL